MVPRKSILGTTLSSDVRGLESQGKVRGKKDWSGKSRKVRENGCKVSKISYFDQNVFKTVFGCDLDAAPTGTGILKLSSAEILIEFGQEKVRKFRN